MNLVSSPGNNTGNILLEGKRVGFLLRKVSIFDCRVNEMLLGMNISLTFSEAVVEKMYTQRMLLRAFGGTVTLQNSVLKDYRSGGSMGVFKEGASLVIFNTELSNITTDLAQGFLLFEGYLNLTNVKIHQFSQSLFQATGTTVSIQQSAFSQGDSAERSQKSRYSFGTILGCMDCRSIRIENVTVTSQFGGAIAIRNTNLTLPAVLIRHSRFVGCSARIGGAVYLLNTAFRIEHCEFTLNTATSTGGAIEANVKKENENMVVSSVFKANKAFEGGAIKWRNAEIVLSGVSFANNTAEYGPDVASYGVLLRSKLWNWTGEGVPGLPISLTFELLDHYGSLVTTRTDTSLSLQNSSSVNFGGYEMRFIRKGVFTFDALTAYALPGSTQTITGVVHTIEGDNHLTIVGTVPIRLRNCTTGEVYHLDTCEYCEAPYFSFSPSDPECRPCPLHVACDGGANFSVSAHYWRNSSDSAEVEWCPLGDKCMGGQNSSCAQGFSGKGCNECDSDSYRYRSVECGKCEDVSVQGVQIGSAVAVFLMFSYGVVRFTIKNPNPMRLFFLKLLFIHSQWLTGSVSCGFPSQPLSPTLSAQSPTSPLSSLPTCLCHVGV